MTMDQSCREDSLVQLAKALEWEVQAMSTEAHAESLEKSAAQWREVAQNLRQRARIKKRQIARLFGEEDYRKLLRYLGAD